MISRRVAVSRPSTLSMKIGRSMSAVGEAVGLRIELRVRLRHLQSERIEPRLEMAAHAIGADQHQRAQAADNFGPVGIPPGSAARQPAERRCRRRSGAAPRRHRWHPPAPPGLRRSATRTGRRSWDRRKAGSVAQRAYRSPRKAAFAPLNAEARMSTPAMGACSPALLDPLAYRCPPERRSPAAERAGLLAPQSSECHAGMSQRRRQEPWLLAPSSAH